MSFVKYPWSEKFGLFNVDFSSPELQRTAKASARYIAQIIRDNGFRSDQPCNNYPISKWNFLFKFWYLVCCVGFYWLQVVYVQKSVLRALKMFVIDLIERRIMERLLLSLRDGIILGHRILYFCSKLRRKHVKTSTHVYTEETMKRLRSYNNRYHIWSIFIAQRLLSKWRHTR